MNEEDKRRIKRQNNLKRMRISKDINLKADEIELVTNCPLQKKQLHHIANPDSNSNSECFYYSRSKMYFDIERMTFIPENRLLPVAKKANSETTKAASEEEEAIQSVQPWEKQRCLIRATDHIFLCTSIVAHDLNFVAQHNIKAVVSFKSTVPLHCQASHLIEYYFYDCDHHPQADLLSHFEAVSSLISLTVANGQRVLLHCADDGFEIGSVFLAAYLMLHKQCTWQNAVFEMWKLEMFLLPHYYDQLALYERLNHRLDVHDPDYRQYKKHVMARECVTGLPKEIEHLPLDSMQRVVPLFKSYITELQQDPNEKEALDQRHSYQCDNCSVYLFNELNLVKFWLQDWFVNNHSMETMAVIKSKSHELCHSVFIEPMDWMVFSDPQNDNAINNNESFIRCPKCTVIIGLFNLSGNFCSNFTKRGICWNHPKYTFCLFKMYKWAIKSQYGRSVSKVDRRPEAKDSVPEAEIPVPEAEKSEPVAGPSSA